MEIKEITSCVDHTNLKQTAVWEDIKKLCDEALKYNTASVCIPPSYVCDAVKYLKGRIKVCTVIGFPNGYNTTAVKVFETADAIKNGADEIDMVINLGDLKDGKYDKILNEINEIKSACKGKILKVIIETCLLSNSEKIKMCEIVSKSDADFIKTSTGFSTGGATREDIEIFKNNVTKSTKIKAAGGIKSLKDAEDFILLGADRLGTSSIIKILEGGENNGNTSY